MLTTAVAVLAAIALLLPGFIVAELAKSGRARGSESDLALALRALAYALVLHTGFAWWTANLADRLSPGGEWTSHVAAIVLYVAVVLMAVPAALGLGLNVYLGRAELQEGKLSRLAVALGGHDSRDAFDYAFQRRKESGAWLIVPLWSGTPARDRASWADFTGNAPRSDRRQGHMTSTWKSFGL